VETANTNLDVSITSHDLTKLTDDELLALEQLVNKIPMVPQAAAVDVRDVANE
jgi:hypothetical protein